MLEHYFDYYTDLFGRRCCALRDPMAVAVALGEARPRLAPRVPVSIDESDGPGRGRLLCDVSRLDQQLRPFEGRGSRVVLSLDEPFAPMLMRRLLSY